MRFRVFWLSSLRSVEGKLGTDWMYVIRSRSFVKESSLQTIVSSDNVMSDKVSKALVGIVGNYVLSSESGFEKVI